MKSGNNITDIEYIGQTVICDTLKVNENGTIELKGCQVVDSQDNSKELSNFYNYINKKLIKAIPYKVYNIGDTFTLNGDSYHIIADSGSNQDYVVALKDTPLTVEEVTTAGGIARDSNGFGGMKYGEDSTYATSAVRSVVDSWAISKFTNSELKQVGDYSARLIQLDELINQFGYEYYPKNDYYINTSSKPDWLWIDIYYFWTMSPKIDNGRPIVEWCVDGTGVVRGCSIFGSLGNVRPVINVYKDKLSS